MTNKTIKKSIIFYFFDKKEKIILFFAFYGLFLSKQFY